MSNRKNSVHFTVDFAKKEIVGTQTALTKAQRYGNDEYKELCKLVEAHPQFKVVKKEVQENKSKKTYKHMDFRFMKAYISIQPNAAELMKEYRQVKEVAETLGLSVYPHTKSWFLKKFGTEKERFDMKKAIEEMKEKGLAVMQFEEAA